MAGNVEERTVRYNIEAKDNATEVWNKFSSNLTQIVSAAALIKFGKDSLFAADALEGLENRAKSVFGNAFPQLSAQTDALSAKFKRSSSDVLNLQAGFGGILSGAGLAGKGVADMSTKMSALSIEFGNFFRISDSDAMDLMQGALLGQTRTLQKYGIELNDVTLQEYMHQQGIKRKVADLSQSELVLQRYNYLMQATTNIQKDGTKATDSFGSEVKTLSGAWNDFEEVFGKTAMPAAMAGLKALTLGVQGVTAAVGQLQDSLHDALWMLGGVLGATDQEKALGAATLLANKNMDVQAANQARFAATGHYGATKADIAKEAQPDLTFGSIGRPDTGGGGKSEIEKARDTATSALKSIKDTYKSTVDDVKMKLVDLDNSHDEKMKSIQKSIDDTKRTVTNLGIEWDKSFKKMTDTKFDTIAAEVKKIADLNQQLADLKSADGGGFANDKLGWVMGNLKPGQDKLTQQNIRDYQLTDDQANYTNIAIQRDKEQSSLDAYTKANPDAMGSQNYKDALVRSNQTDFTKSIGSQDDNMKDAKAKYEEQLAHYKDEQKALDDSKKKEEDLYVARKKAYNDTLADLKKFMNTWIGNMQNIDKVTDEITENLKHKLDDLRNTIQSIDALMQRKSNITGGGTLTSQVQGRYSGGTVGADEYTVVGEDGPELAKFPAGTQILSTSQSKRASGGGSGDVIIHGSLIGQVIVPEPKNVQPVMQELARQIQLLKRSSSR